LSVLGNVAAKVAVPDVASAVKVAGEPEKPVTVATTVLVPAVLLNLNDAPATPLASVVTLAGVTAPPPVAANVTVAPGTGFPNESVAFALIALELATVADAGRSACFVRCAIAPGETVTETGVEVTEVPIAAVIFAAPTGPREVTNPLPETAATFGAELV
jgi:hypothetical protein